MMDFILEVIFRHQQHTRQQLVQIYKLGVTLCFLKGDQELGEHLESLPILDYPRLFKAF